MYWELDAVSPSFTPPPRHPLAWALFRSLTPLLPVPFQDMRPEDPLSAHALIPIVTSEMGGIDRNATNCLEYPGSKWDNLRKGMN